MAHRFHPRSTPAEHVRVIFHSIPWKLLFLLPVLIVIAVPTYLYATRAGGNVVPSITDLFYKLSAPAPPPTPTPLPVFPSGLPQAGSLLYTVQDGDSCDSILLFQMHMLNAGEIFSDIKPETVRALNASLGQDCHLLQPGMTLPLSPHYPLVALGGVVSKSEGSTTQQVWPTPLIKIPPQQQLGTDCSGKGGCLLTLRIAPAVSIHLLVQTALPVNVGSWIWAQASIPARSFVALIPIPTPIHMPRSMGQPCARAMSRWIIPTMTIRSRAAILCRTPLILMEAPGSSALLARVGSTTGIMD